MHRYLTSKYLKVLGHGSSPPNSSTLAFISHWCLPWHLSLINIGALTARQSWSLTLVCGQTSAPAVRPKLDDRISTNWCLQFSSKYSFWQVVTVMSPYISRSAGRHWHANWTCRYLYLWMQMSPKRRGMAGTCNRNIFSTFV